MSNRSGSPYSAPTDANRNPLLIAASTADGITPVVLEADPVTHLLQVSSSGGGGGTQYQELAITSPATGTLALGRYLSSLPTLTNGQMNEPLLDSSSRLLVSQPTAAALNATVIGTGTFAVQSTLQAGSTTTVTQGTGTNLHTVTDSGSVTAATLSAETTKVIGTVNQGTSPWVVNTGSATGSSVPANAFYIGMNGASGNLTGWASLAQVASDAIAGGSVGAVGPWIYNGTNWDRVRSATSANNTTGTGVLGAAPMVQYKSSAPTVTDGDYYAAQADINGNTKVYLATKIDNVNDSITAYPFGHSYAHISTATTTTVKSGAGVLHNISVNTLGTVASTCTVYDNTAGSGTIIAVINTLSLSGAFVLDVAFSTGLTLVTTGTVAPDITVSYR